IHCFVYVESGETLVTIGNETYLFKAGDCGVIPAGQVFSVRYWDDCTGYMGGFHTDFLNADCSGRSVLRSFAFLRKWGSHKIHFGQLQSPFVENILRRLENESSSSNNRDILRTYLTALLVEIEQARDAETPPEPDLDHKLCNDFVEYIFENPACDHTVGFHAARLNVSPPHLTRTVKNLTGKTPQAWINEAVILEAKVLLEHTDLPVGEVAGRVGHGEPEYFTRRFRKSVGMAPMGYRAHTKNPKI
ncbi:MAG: AraC family transcriptional regulator, partial [Alistipes sp.]|nr:AraC family transcriptional regulator [Alistipes sp.]